MLRKTGLFLLNLLEIYIPVASFVVMFLAFIIQIVARYFFNDPLTWPFELTTLTFVWTVMFAAAYSMRTDDHIVFALIYDKVSPRIQAVFRMISNGLLFIGFGIALYPVYDYVQFMATQATPVLKVPFNVVYFPLLIFMVLIMGHCAYNFAKDIRRFRGQGQQDGQAAIISDDLR